MLASQHSRQLPGQLAGKSITSASYKHRAVIVNKHCLTFLWFRCCLTSMRNFPYCPRQGIVCLWIGWRMALYNSNQVMYVPGICRSGGNTWATYNCIASEKVLLWKRFYGNICRICNLLDNAAKCWLQMHLTGFILVLKCSGHEHCWLLFCLVIILLFVTTVVCRSPSKLGG